MLKLYQSNRVEYLVDLLADVISRPLQDPFSPETIVVQHPAMGRWLSLRLADRLGVCANTRFPLPAGFVWSMFRLLIGDVPEQNRFAPAVMQWRIFELLDELRTEKAFAPVGAYLRSVDLVGRYELAGRIADCFDRYLVYRPDWIQRWEKGQPAVEGDAWQAELWRRLVHSLGSDHWARLMGRFIDTHGRPPEKLPDRMLLFGISTLSAGFLETLNRLSGWTDIHLFLFNPCELHWTDIVSADQKYAREKEDEALYLDVGNPLLASMGRQGRDFFASVLNYDPGSADFFSPPEFDSLLHRLQGDILQLRDGTAGNPRQISDQDRSILINSCHGPMREVEVLHDQLLDLLQQHPDLQPEQILVMTPDMDLYAPYIEAVFGDAPEKTALPFDMADRGTVAGNAIVGGFTALLNLSASRYEVNDMLALLELPFVRRRFGLQDADLVPIIQWLRETRVRWGRDAGTRSSLGLPPTDQNSWQAGLDRLLLGYAMQPDDDTLFQGMLPCDEVEGALAPVLGGLVSFCGAAFDLQEQLAGDHPIEAWCRRLLAVMERFFEPTEAEEPQLQQLRDAVGSMAELAALAGFSQPLPLDLVQAQLNSRVSSMGTGGVFLAGGINFCALSPMRSLPFEVICMIGLNDGRFPRDRRSPGFDLMAGQTRAGDRSARADDRYLFLETLLSARRCLYISYIGQDQGDNSVLPPSVMVSELLDYLDQSYHFDSGKRIAARLPQRHPLQGFNPGYFSGSGELFSYSTVARNAAVAALGPKAQAVDLVPRLLSEPGQEWRHIGLEQLVEFYANPTRFLLRRRLGVLLEREAGPLEARDPFDLHRFEASDVCMRLIQGELSGVSETELYRKERARGGLPHGAMGEQLFGEIRRRADRFAGIIRTEGLKPGEATTDLDFTCNGFRLKGRIEGVGPTGITGFGPGRLPVSRLLGVWIRHLAVNVAEGQGAARETRWLDEDGVIRLPPLDNAAELLRGLLHLYWEGLASPLRLFPRSSLEYQKRLQESQTPDKALASAWRVWAGEFQFRSEFQDPYYQLAFPGGDVLDEVFEQVSTAVFGPLLEVMERT